MPIKRFTRKYPYVFSHISTISYNYWYGEKLAINKLREEGLQEANVSNFLQSLPATKLDFLLKRKDFVTDMHVYVVYVKERLPFARDLSFENF